MKYSVNVPDDLAMAAKAAAERAGVNQATWTRGALESALKPAGPIEDLMGLQQDLGQVRDELGETQKVLVRTQEGLDSVTAELGRTWADLEATRGLAGELEDMRAQLRAAEGRVKWVELDVDRAKEDGLKALENANRIVVEKDERIGDLRRALGLAEGQLAEAARREMAIMERIPRLTEQSGSAGRPWWSRWFRRT